ncbi:MAG TPA: lactonase family protein [Candidatus Limnocylindria bacterium]|jgi:6-phosphogluconolactonase|nr:lactonase family protein [Candidatus Limnocylindria bacterium]
MKPRSIVRFASALVPAAILSFSAQADRFLAYVGTYTGPQSEGIYAYRFDSGTGVAEPLGLVATTKNPTFLAVHPDGKHLYAANETDTWKGQPGGYVTAYRIDTASGRLTEVNAQSTVGAGPCHVNVDATGHALIAANYGGGSLVTFRIAADGSLQPHASFIQHTGSSVNPQRQKEAHVHSANLSRDNRCVFVCDLGLDKVFVYDLDPSKATLTAHEPPFATLAPGTGPRHLAWSPHGKFAFVNGEMLSTLTSFRYDAEKGRLSEVQTVPTLPADFKGNSTTAEVRVHPNGKFVYVSNRGHDSITVFRTDGKGGLSLVEHVPTQGKTPRNFNFDPSAKWLWAENQDSNSIFLYSVNAETGHLTPTGQKLEVGAPVCVRFVAVK